MICQVLPEQSQNPKWVLALLYIFIVGCYLSPTLSFSKLIIVLIGIISFIYFLSHRSAFYALAAKEKLLIVFLFLTVLSCSWGDKGSFIYALKSSLVLLFFIFIFSKFKKEIYAHLDAALMVVVFSAAILAIILLYDHFAMYGFNFKVKIHKIYGPIVQTIRTASIFTFALLIITWTIFTNKGWRKRVCMVLFFPVFLAMLLLQSRGAALALCVGLSVLFIFHNWKSSKVFRHPLIRVTLLGLLVAIGAFFNLEYNPKGITDTVRIPIWRQSISEVYPERFWWGMGYGKSQEVVTVGESKYVHSHNIFVSIFHITGAVGLLTFAAYLIGVVRRNLTEKMMLPETSLCWAWLATAMCTFFFNGRYPVYIAPDVFLILWMPLALL